MLSKHIASQIYTKFTFEPTFGQEKVIEKLSEWIISTNFDKIFVLNGYAGTGKTTLVSAFVKTLIALKIKPILLAPTGRAAKVMSRYCEIPANTIHKKIYRQKNLASVESSFSLDFNKEQDACFIIDEASMLSSSTMDKAIFGSGDLLEDLLEYVRKGVRCRVMFVGDSAQLPPIGMERSPALDPAHLSMYGEVEYVSLDDVVRQQSDSGILFNATLVRCMFENGIYEPPLLALNYPDVKAITGGELLEELESCYYKYGRDETIVITRSNKRANRFNEGIRRNVLYAEEQIESGDMLMVVKNNYHYTERIEKCPIDFIANGDIATLKRIRRFEELYGFNFAQAELSFGDYDDYTIECKVILDTLSSESPSLTREQNSELFYAVAEDYADIPQKRKRYMEVRENSHFNAVQIKFAYAVTCHKAQGGEWSAVFIDKMLFGDEPMSRDLMRWLYTAITRATERLYFVNFDDRFLDSSDKK